MRNDASIVATYLTNDVIEGIAIINPLQEAIGYTLPDEYNWGVLINGDFIETYPSQQIAGDVTVPAQGVLLVVPIP